MTNNMFFKNFIGFPRQTGWTISISHRIISWLFSELLLLLQLGQEYPLEKEMATHSSILAWEIPRTGRLQSLGSQKCHTWLSNYISSSVTGTVPGIRDTKLYFLFHGLSSSDVTQIINIIQKKALRLIMLHG